MLVVVFKVYWEFFLRVCVIINTFHQLYTCIMSHLMCRMSGLNLLLHVPV